MDDIFEVLEGLKKEHPDKIQLIDQCLRSVSLWLNIRGSDVPKSSYLVECYKFVISELDEFIPKGWWNIFKAWAFKTLVKYIVKKLLESLVEN